jgi:hypothetical protein
MLRGRSWAGRRLTWNAFNKIKERTPLLKPKLRLPHGKRQAAPRGTMKKRILGVPPGSMNLAGVNAVTSRSAQASEEPI